MTDKIVTVDHGRVQLVNPTGPADCPTEDFEMQCLPDGRMLNFWGTITVQFDCRLPLEDKITMFRAMMAIAEGKLA